MESPMTDTSATGEPGYSRNPLDVDEWPVIIIGSSMVGKALGLLLGYHGIKSVSFDRHPAAATHPRAAGLNIRTGEILRQLGLEQITMEQSGKEYDINAGMLVAENLVGKNVITRLQQHDPEELKKITPSSWVWISQAMFEPILGDNAGRFNSVQLHGYDVVHYEEHSKGVTVVVKEVKTNSYRKYNASYLVACDGSRSTTRQKEGISLDGPGFLQNCLNISFEADLSRYIGNRVVYGVVYVTNQQVQGGFRLEDGGRKGLFIVTGVSDRTSLEAGTVTLEQAGRYLREGAGTNDITNDHITSYAVWPLAAYNADRLASRGGRVFIAGDAAHVMPPTGGFGGNTGIADVHNIAWKLAYVLTGKASPGLLQTYNSERQPINGFTVGEAYKRFQSRLGTKVSSAPETMDAAVELGYRYLSGAFVSKEGENKTGNLWDDPREPSAVAGSRFPHVFLHSATNPNQRISSIDLVKRNFVLIILDSRSPWLAAVSQVALTIDTYVLNESSTPFRDPDRQLQRMARLQDGDALLIRPDGFIAWRAEARSWGHEHALKGALESVLGHNFMTD